jgi:hypothetical protein
MMPRYVFPLRSPLPTIYTTHNVRYPRSHILEPPHQNKNNITSTNQQAKNMVRVSVSVRPVPYPTYLIQLTSGKMHRSQPKDPKGKAAFSAARFKSELIERLQRMEKSVEGNVGLGLELTPDRAVLLDRCLWAMEDILRGEWDDCTFEVGAFRFM